MNTIIIGSFVLSVLHSILFWDKNAGISAILFCIPAVLFLVYILDKREKIKSKEALWLAIPIGLLSLTYFIFNNEVFRVLNFFAITGLFTVMVIWATSMELKVKLIIQKIFSVILGPIEFAGETMKTIKQFITPKDDNKDSTKAQFIKKVIIAIVVSIPIVLIVLALLISADSVFADIFKGVSEYIERLIIEGEIFFILIRLLVILILFVYTASFIYNLIEEKTAYTVVEEVNKGKKDFKISGFTMNTILTFLNIIYLIFSIVQFIYLFTKAGVAADFNYAYYARQGFFQLLFVSIINFAIVLFSNFIKENETDKSKKYTNIMNIAICIFTIVIIFSSFVRMNMYEQEFGYTYLRLFVYFALFTELILMIPTVLHVVKGKVDLFKYYLIIVTAMYIILNFANLDNLIAKKNIDRYFQDTKENEIDFSYLINNTGTDAISQIIRLLEAEDSKVKRDVVNYLYNEKEELNEEKRAWQETNLSIINAKNKLNHVELEKTNYYDVDYYDIRY